MKKSTLIKRVLFGVESFWLCSLVQFFSIGFRYPQLVHRKPEDDEDFQFGNKDRSK